MLFIIKTKFIKSLLHNLNVKLIKFLNFNTNFLKNLKEKQTIIPWKYHIF